MTGTSADALDVAVVEFSDAAGQLHLRILDFREIEFESALRCDILTLLSGDDVTLNLVSRVDAALGQFCGRAAAEVVEALGVDCDLVVSHGQTVYHDIADGHVTSTVQLGQPAWIAERIGCPVLSDVRSRDVAAGGQGAPLVGILDELLVGETQRTTAVLNLGGIANITVVGPSGESVSFDTGPANALIDLMARHISAGAQAFDRDGVMARGGAVDEGLLEELLRDPYYALSTPKSTGKELFNQAYLDRFRDSRPDLNDRDVIATVTALTARTVAQACHAHGVETVVASGGGTRNPTLMAMLKQELGPDVSLTTTDVAWGLPEGAKEACLMALIGWLSWHGLPATLPHLTGARQPRVAGRLTPGPSPLALPAPRREPPKALRLVSGTEAASPDHSHD